MASTIFALASGSPPCAVAMFRISGQRSLQVLRALTKRKKVEPRKMFYCKVYESGGDVLDTGMGVFFAGPRSFTGEDSAELFVHGGRANIAAIERRLHQLEGVRAAQAGEFTRRALLNGKMDVHDVCSLGALLSSQTERQRKHSRRLLTSAQYIRDKLSSLVAKANTIIDFSEDVQESMHIKESISELLAELRGRSRRESGSLLMRGIRVVLVGPPNVGKSSLFNALSRTDRTIVSPHAGTTRDCVEMTLDLNGVPVVLVDTAGLRHTQDAIEEEGIRRTRRSIDDADIVIIVHDGTSREKVKVPEGKEVIVVHNKADLASGSITGIRTVATQGGIEQLETELKRVIDQLCPDTNELILNQGYDQVAVHLEHALSEHDMVLMAEELQSAADAWGRPPTSEQILSSIFSQFCVGK